MVLKVLKVHMRKVVVWVRVLPPACAPNKPKHGGACSVKVLKVHN